MAHELRPRTTKQFSAVERQLKEALTAFLRLPKDAPRAADAPIVFTEKRPHMYHLGRQLVYYVVWDRFDGVDGESRFRIMFHALREALPPEVVIKITAMEGYTKAEAERFELKY
jgi:hypothetical protein